MSGKKNQKKETREKVVQQLTKAFQGLKETLGEKKFERRIRKAAKILSAGTSPVKEKSVAAKKVKTPAVKAKALAAAE